MERIRLAGFVGRDWADWIGPWFYSPEWETINRVLQIRKKTNIAFAPLEKNIFRAFKECPFYSLNTVILTDNCYSTVNNIGKPLADGLAFSAKDSVFCPDELEKIFFALDDTLYGTGSEDVISDTDDFDLKRWAAQGILMINCEFTTLIGGETSTKNDFLLWQPFLVYLLDRLDFWKEGLNIIAIGEKSKEYLGMFGNPSHNLLSCESPKLAKAEKRSWDHNNIFKDLNISLEKQNIKMKW